MSETQPKPLSARSGAVPLTALRAFEAAARLGGVLAAAEEIGLTASAVSHHVRNLEMALGGKLFVRVHRGVVLTEKGAELAEKLTPAFAAISAAYLGGRALGRLRLSAAPAFASQFILPKLAALQALIPGTVIEVASELDRTDLSRAPDLLGLFYGPEPKGLAVRLVAESPFTVVASPDWIRANGSGGAALETASLLTLTRRSLHWDVVFRRLKLTGQRREVFFDSSDGVLHAAEAGHGVAVLPALVCQPGVRAGRLAAVVADTLDTRWRYWLAAAPDSPAAKHLPRVARWLAEQIASQAPA